MSTIEVAQRAQGYRAALERPRCGLCSQCVRVSGDGLRCQAGNFLVSSWAICERFAFKAESTPTPAAGGVR